ncbi:hypothetical protein HanIR_Chr02g0073431 [Helianthus annuus]|nr:hypothetical protein HanIR_Chr02g0073431 [Helianthus annuus]
MGRVSTIWPEPEYFPTLRWNGEGYYGFERCPEAKSFDSGELELQATKTPKEDPPYLSIVSENLYKIRDPVATADQGGSVSAPPEQAGSALSEQAIRVSPLRSVSVVASDKGKCAGSSGAKNSGSKVILYGSEHLSVEEESVAAEGGDAGGQLQISLKRHRNPLLTSDPNLKELKKNKLASKIVILEDEADLATEFSAAEGLLENLDAHLHGGKTSRDRPFTFPSIPLLLGDPTTKLVANTEMPDPVATPGPYPREWAAANQYQWYRCLSIWQRKFTSVP